MKKILAIAIALLIYASVNSLSLVEAGDVVQPDFVPSVRIDHSNPRQALFFVINKGSRSGEVSLSGLYVFLRAGESGEAKMREWIGDESEDDRHFNDGYHGSLRRTIFLEADETFQMHRGTLGDGIIPENAVKVFVKILRVDGITESDYTNNTWEFDLSTLATTPTPTPTPTPSLTPTPTPISTPKGTAALKQNLTYPIRELGNCKSKADCKKYCDLKENIKKCLKYGAKTGLMSQAEVAAAETVTETINGPDGCTDQESCAKVCDDPANMEVCLEYAQKNKLMTDDELEKAKKVMQIISGGAKTPGDCKTPKACQQYCSGDGSHIKECIEFAKGAGLMSADEANQMEKRDFLKNGGPGGCKSREECEVYCENDDHAKECEAFFKNAGVIDSKVRDSSKPPKTGGGAVCTTLEECKAFCKNPANAEACKNVVIKDSGSSGPEIGGDLGALVGNINQMPEESKECLKQALGAETFEKLMKGEMPTTPISGDVMQSCFAKGVEEYEQKAMPTKKPDDFSLEYGPGPSSDDQVNPGGVPEVQGISTAVRSLFDIVLEWFRR